MLKTIQQLLEDINPRLRTVNASTAAIERESNKGWLIDVREPAEHLVSPAVGAINIPRGVIEMKMIELVQDPDYPLYLHCASSARARLAAEQLMRIGYKNVSVITCAVPTIQDVFEQK